MLLLSRLLLAIRLNLREKKLLSLGKMREILPLTHAIRSMDKLEFLQVAFYLLAELSVKERFYYIITKATMAGPWRQRSLPAADIKIDRHTDL
jgi:hypothetical protein